jgi:serum/glucocorticoid-regulated kinase 2
MDDLGNVSLTDFGMAKILKEGQVATTFCGTP